VSTLTTGGSDTLSSAQFVFGPTSYRRGSSTGVGARLTALSSTDYLFGTSDFTIETRWRSDVVNATGAWIFDMDTDLGSRACASLYHGNSGFLSYFINGTTLFTTSSAVVTANTWYALAVCRVSNTTRIFVNGTIVGSFADSNNYNAGSSATVLDIPTNSSRSNNATNANYEEFRITNGVGRYSANYAPAGQPFPNH
jgi:hypothetical protein